MRGRADDRLPRDRGRPVGVLDAAMDDGAGRAEMAESMSLANDLIGVPSMVFGCEALSALHQFS